MMDERAYQFDHFTELEREVIDTGLCNRCGTCVGVCPEDCLEMCWPDLVPSLVTGKDCTSCRLCIQVCPARGVPYDEVSLELFDRSPAESEFFGACRAYYLGHTADADVWRRAAGGGIVSTLAAWLIDSGRVDGVILCGASDDEPWKTVGKVVRTREEVLDNAGSHYSVVPINASLKQVREEPGKYALVGAGCHISGFRKMARADSGTDWAEIVPLTIGIMCGGNVMPSATLHLIEREMGIQDLTRVTAFRHRGIGGTAAEALLTNGEQVQLRQHFGFQHLRMQFLYKCEGCRFCIDSVNELADLTVGDYDNRSEGVLYVRSEHGARLVEDAREAEILELEEIDYVTVLKGGSTFAFLKAMRAAQEKVERLEAAIPAERTLAARGGMRLYTLLRQRRRKGMPVPSYDGRWQFYDRCRGRDIGWLARVIWWAQERWLFVSLFRRLPRPFQFELQKLSMGYGLGEPFHGAGEEAQRRIRESGWSDFLEQAEKSREDNR